MSILKTCFSLLSIVPLAIATTATAKTQCVEIDIPEFNLLPDIPFFNGTDSECRISTSKLRSKLPDQVLLYEKNIPADLSCFFIVKPGIFPVQPSVDAFIMNPETNDELAVTVSGIAGLTDNAYPPRLSGTISFTAATIVSISLEGELLGSLVTRDAGTVFADVDDNGVDVDNAAARLSVVKGTGDFKKGITGYIDEVGQEFNPSSPANAKGILCGKDLADKLFDD